MNDYFYNRNIFFSLLFAQVLIQLYIVLLTLSQKEQIFNHVTIIVVYYLLVCGDLYRFYTRWVK